MGSITKGLMMGRFLRAGLDADPRMLLSGLRVLSRLPVPKLPGLTAKLIPGEDILRAAPVETRRVARKGGNKELPKYKVTQHKKTKSVLTNWL